LIGLVGRSRIDIGVSNDREHDINDEDQRQQAHNSDENGDTARASVPFAAVGARLGFRRNRLQAAVANFPRRPLGCLFHRPCAQYTTRRRRKNGPCATFAAGYNRGVRTGYGALVFLCLAGCNRGVQSKDAVRQGVLDHLSQRQLNVAAMNVEVTSVQFNGNQAEATVSFTPKGGNAAQGMSMRYQLEQRGGRWVVVGRKDAGSGPHGGAAMPSVPPGMENPHGGGAPSEPGTPGGGRAMPAPEDLPPAGQKK